MSKQNHSNHELLWLPIILPVSHKYLIEFTLSFSFNTVNQHLNIDLQVTESIAGRVGVVRLLGLSNSEINGNHFSAFEVDPSVLIDRTAIAKPMALMAIFERIYKGSMPRLYEIENMNQDEYYESYLETYISRDIKDLTQVANELAFLNFISIVAARTATNVNYDALANEADITAPTAKHWLSILVSSGLVALIPPYSNNALKRVIKAPRMYFLDTGLCAYLTRWTSAENLECGAMNGQFFETWVVSEIFKSYINNGKRPSLYFYRDSNHKEIDVILYQNGKIYPIEIKKSSSPKDAIKNFSVLKPIEKEPAKEDIISGAAHLKTDIGTGAVICLSADIIPIDHNNWFIPAWLI